MSDHTPTVSVVSGSPTPEELAAIITILTASAANATAEAPASNRPRVGGWKSYARTLRQAHHPGPGAWKHGLR